MDLRNIFENNVMKTEGNGKCWIWQGNIGNHGYGRLGFCGNTLMSHRVSYEIYNGIILPDKAVLHKCHNRLCVNPEHLYLGTAQDNARDWLEARKKEREAMPGIIQDNASLSAIREIEKQLIANTLKKNNQCRTTTAKQIGISTTTLWRKMKKYCIE